MMNKYLEKAARKYNMDKEDRKILRQAYAKQPGAEGVFSATGAITGTGLGAAAAAYRLKKHYSPSNVRSAYRAVREREGVATMYNKSTGEELFTKKDAEKYYKEDLRGLGAQIGQQTPVKIPRWYGEMSNPDLVRLGSDHGGYIPKSTDSRFLDLEQALAKEQESLEKKWENVRRANIATSVVRKHDVRQELRKTEPDIQALIAPGAVVGAGIGAGYGHHYAFKNFKEHMQGKYGDNWAQTTGWEYSREKSAALSEQRQFERYVATKPDYQSAWVNSINTGAELGAAAAISPEVWRALKESRTQEELMSRVVEAPGQVWSKSKGRVMAAVGAGALAGTAYGAMKHAAPARNHYRGYDHVPGVPEYATGEIAPVVGRLAGAPVGGGLAATAAKRLRLGSKERLAAGLVGGILGAKIGDKLVSAHNTALLNRLREKYY